MELKRALGFLLVATLMGFVSLSSSSEAYQFNVGGRDGWLSHPSEDYNHWAQRTRFQVNDTLFFKGSDSVLVVGKDDYYSCNTTNPIISLTHGDSVFKFDRSGPFFFISGNADNCNKGQRLIVVVLAVRDRTRQAPPSPPSEAAPPKASAKEDIMNTTSYLAAPTPTPNGSGATSVSLVLSAVCVGFMAMVFW